MRVRWRKRAGGRITAAVAAVALATATIVAGQPAGARTGDRVIVWGDSLVVEASAPLRFFGGISGMPVTVRAWPGTAPCDWAFDVAWNSFFRAGDLAVLAFAGNNFTPCMADPFTGLPLQGDQLMIRYKADLTMLVDQLRAVGMRVLIVAPPPLRGRDDLAELRQLPRLIAEGRPGVGWVDGGAFISINGEYLQRATCLPWEGPLQGCGPDGLIEVRSFDGVHLCPTGPLPDGSCAVFSAGAVRYALAVSAAMAAA